MDCSSFERRKSKLKRRFLETFKGKNLWVEIFWCSAAHVYFWGGGLRCDSLINELEEY